MTVICGTDFSTAAADAMHVAAAFARARGEELVLVHSIDPGPLAMMSGDISSVLSQGAARELDRASDQLRGYGIPIRTQLELGFPDVSILRIARGTSASLIVVGSVGHRGRLSWPLGSTAEKVIRAAPAAVLVVRERRPIENWLRGESTLRLMLATDLTPASDAAIDWTAQLIDTDRPSEVIVAYVSWPPGDQQRFGLSGPMDLTKLEPSLREILERELAQAAARVDPRAKRVVEPNFGRQADAIVGIAIREKADVLVVGSRQEPGSKRLWHGSTSQGVVHAAPMNVVVVPAALTMAVFPEIRCILAATDFSEAGNRACTYAISLAPAAARVVLMTVVEAAERDQASKRLTEIAADAASLTSATVESFIEQSKDIAAAISAVADRIDADLICLGSRKRGALAKTMLGSVVEKVLAQSRLPVLIVTGD